MAEAIDEKNPAHLKEELGDVLLQVLFHASIEEDAGRFTLDDVADGICKKLIFRHPHVFGGAAATPDSWEELKRQEKGQTTYTATLQSVAKSLPGLWRAEKIQAKAEKAGFEWPRPPWTSSPRSWRSSRPRWRTTATWRKSWATCCLPQ